jgi:hypothetical protein
MCTAHSVTSSTALPTRLGDLSSTFQRLMTTMPRSLAAPGSENGSPSVAGGVQFRRAGSGRAGQPWARHLRKAGVSLRVTTG